MPVYMRCVPFLPFGVPKMVLTATATISVCCSIIKCLNMKDCSVASKSPNKFNIFYVVKRCSGNFEDNFTNVVKDVAQCCESKVTDRLLSIF